VKSRYLLFLRNLTLTLVSGPVSYNYTRFEVSFVLVIALLHGLVKYTFFHAQIVYKIFETFSKVQPNISNLKQFQIKKIMCDNL